MSEIKFKKGDKVKINEKDTVDITESHTYEITDTSDECVFIIDDEGDEQVFEFEHVELVESEQKLTFPRMMLVRDHECDNWIQKEVHAIVSTMDYPYITNENVACNWKYGKEIEGITDISKAEAEKIISKIQGKTVKITN